VPVRGGTHDSCVSARALATHFLFGLDWALGIQLFCTRTSEAWDRVDCIGRGLLVMDFLSNIGRNVIVVDGNGLNDLHHLRMI
jgi:hypothetical protein